MQNCKRYNFYLVCLSSVFYFFALHFDCFFFLIFIFLIPILFLEKNYGFIKGLLWGAVFYSFHFFSIFKIFFNVDHVYWFLPPLILIIYFSFWSGIWFLLNFKLQSIFYSRIRQVSVFALTSFLYFIFVDCFILSFIEFGCGYAISSPLNALSFLGYLQPRSFYLLTIIILNLLLYFFFINKKIYSLVIFFFVLALLLSKKEIKVFSLKNEKIISFCEKPIGPIERILEIKKAINTSLKVNSEIKNIFFPESTFPFPINETTYLLNWLPKEVNIFLCCHWKKKNKLLNCVLHIFNGQIVNKYYKKRLVPVVEYIPKFLKLIPGLKSQFMKNSLEFASGKKSNKFIINNKKFDVLICSDLFFKSALDIKDAKKDKVICFVNNAWFDNNYQKLLHKTVRVLYRQCIIIGY